jgi:dipeptidyl aminopeptidase/acylaminoacyl peptidase
LFGRFSMTGRTLDRPLPAARRTSVPRVRLKLIAIGVGAVLAVCLIAVVLAWRASSVLMNPPLVPYSWSLATYPALKASEQPLTIHSSTGVTLTGRFFRGTEGATVVLSHGYGGDQDEMLPVANALHAAGFNVVTYNERGRSGAEITLGKLESKDLRSVIDVVSRNPGVNPSQIGEFGFSMGGATTILEAASDPRIKAVVDDAGWSQVQDWTRTTLSDAVLHPTSMFSPLSLKLFELRTGANLNSIRPEDFIARISPRPILIIHGTADNDVPPRASQVNYAHAKAPRTLWMVPNEGHEATISPGGAATTPRLGAFFTRALLSAHS